VYYQPMVVRRWSFAKPDIAGAVFAKLPGYRPTTGRKKSGENSKNSVDTLFILPQYLVI